MPIGTGDKRSGTTRSGLTETKEKGKGKEKLVGKGKATDATTDLTKRKGKGKFKGKTSGKGKGNAMEDDGVPHGEANATTMHQKAFDEAYWDGVSESWYSGAEWEWSSCTDWTSGNAFPTFVHRTDGSDDHFSSWRPVL